MNCNCRHFLRILRRASENGFNGECNYDIDQLNKMYNNEWGDYSNMLSCNINQITAYNIYRNFKNCKCCDRHQLKKTNMEFIYLSEIKILIY